MDGTLTKSQAIMEKAPIAKRQRLKRLFGFLVGSAETQQKSGAVRKASESDKGTEVAYEKRGHSRQNSTVKVEKIAIDYKDERDVYNHGGVGFTPMLSCLAGLCDYNMLKMDICRQTRNTIPEISMNLRNAHQLLCNLRDMIYHPQSRATTWVRNRRIFPPESNPSNTNSRKPSSPTI